MKEDDLEFPTLTLRSRLWGETNVCSKLGLSYFFWKKTFLLFYALPVLGFSCGEE